MYPTEPQPQYGATPSATPYSGPPASGPPASGPPAGTPDPQAGYGAPPQAYPQPTAATPPPGDRKLALGDLLTAVGGLLVLAFSFAPFVTYDEQFIRLLKEEGDFPEWFSAWSLQTFMGPLSWWPVLAALGLIALTVLRFVLPRDVEFVGFRINHLQVGLSLFSFFVLIGYALSGKYAFFAEELTEEFANGMRRVSTADVELSFSWGGYLMLVGAIIAATGAVLNQLDVGPTVWPQAPRPPATFPQSTVYGRPATAYPQQQAYGVPQGYATPQQQAQPQQQAYDPAANQTAMQPTYDPAANQTAPQPTYDPAAYQQQQQQPPPVESYQHDHTTPPQSPGQQSG